MPRQQFAQQFGHIDFGFGRRAKGQAFLGGGTDCGYDLRMRMARHHGAPGADVIDVAPAFGVPHAGTLARAINRGAPPRRETPAPGN